MHVSESFKSWEKQMEREILGFFVRLGAREAPESWRAESSDDDNGMLRQDATDNRSKQKIGAC